MIDLVENLRFVSIGLLSGLIMVLATHVILAEEFEVIKPGVNGWVKVGTFHCAIWRPDDNKVILDDGTRLKPDGTLKFVRID